MALRSWVSRDPLVATRKLVVSAAAAALLLLRQPSFHHQSQAYATAPDHTQGRINNNGQDYLLGTLPQTMRAAVFWEPGKPMTIEDLKLPRPQFGEVLVKTKGEEEEEESTFLRSWNPCYPPGFSPFFHFSINLELGIQEACAEKDCDVQEFALCSLWGVSFGFACDQQGSTLPDPMCIGPRDHWWSCGAWCTHRPCHCS